MWSGREGPRKLLSLLVVLVIPFVPLVGVLVICGIGLAVLAVGLVYVLTAATPWGWRRLVEPRIRVRLRNLNESGWTMKPLAKPTYLLRSWSKELGKLGFVPVLMGEHPEGIRRATLVKPGEGVIADILDQAVRLDRMPLPSVNLISVMPNGRGALSTSIGPRVRGSDRLITQHEGVVFPATLLARHQEARRLLFEQGIGFVPVEASDTMEVLGWVSNEIVGALLAVPAGSLRVRMRELFGRRLVVSMLDEPDVLERIQALRQAPEPNAPGSVARGWDPYGP